MKSNSKSVTSQEYGMTHFAKWLATAGEILSKPPVRPWTIRSNPKGDLVAQFVLPLHLCKTTNATRHASGWKQGLTKAEIKKLMDWQELAFRKRIGRPEPLSGRPQVFCVRFDSRETDATADFGKAAIDYLGRDSQRQNKKTGHVTYIRRLNYLHDDAPRWCELHYWQEHCPHKDGFVLIQIRIGEQ